MNLAVALQILGLAGLVLAAYLLASTGAAVLVGALDLVLVGFLLEREQRTTAPSDT